MLHVGRDHLCVFLVGLRMLLQQFVLLGVMLHVGRDHLCVFLNGLRMLLQQLILLGVVLLTLV